MAWCVEEVNDISDGLPLCQSGIKSSPARPGLTLAMSWVDRGRHDGITYAPPVSTKLRGGIFGAGLQELSQLL